MWIKCVREIFMQIRRTYGFVARCGLYFHRESLTIIANRTQAYNTAILAGQLISTIPIIMKCRRFVYCKPDQKYTHVYIECIT